jgi:transposase-like protein
VPRTRPPYPPEFREEAIRLTKTSGYSIRQVAKDLGISDQTLRNWVNQADVDAGKRREWERGIGIIERYRQENGITDRTRAFGTEPERSLERTRREAELRRLREVQRRLGREQHRVRRMERRLGFGLRLVR